LIFRFALRYLIAKKSTNAINIIAWVSIGAITIVTAAMIIILSVFNGLTDLVKSLYNGFYTDIKIIAATGKVVTLTPEQYNTLKNINGVKAVSFVAEEKAMLKINQNQTIVTLKGVDDNFTKITTLSTKIVRGDYELGTIEKPKLILGYGVENALGINSNQIQANVNIFIPNYTKRFTGSIDDFNNGEATPTSTFAIQQDFDNKYAISNLGFVKTLIGLDSNQYTNIEIGLINNIDNNESEAIAIQEKLQKLLGNNYVVQTKFQQNKSLYNVIKYEKWFVYAIFCLVLFIASFTIVGSLTMLVLEKKKDIGILKSMGANDTYIKKIFLAEGLLLAIVGIGAGVVLGILICLAQQYFHIVKLSGGSFLVDYYPVHILLPDMLLIISTVAIITIFASYLPARKAAKQLLELRN
jgi:lipoprotein-releasing system permease protein